MKSGIITASLVLIPPVVGSFIYMASLKGSAGEVLWGFGYMASVAIVLWLFSLFLKRRTFIAGLIGLHVMTAYFLFAMSRHWVDDVFWIMYLPNVFVGLVVGITISYIAKKTNQWIHRTPR